MLEIVALITLLLVPCRLLAHQPVLNEFESSQVNPYVIKDPEVSKAIFSTLNGDSHYYQISSPVEFRFYAGITTPKIDDCDVYQRFAFSVFDEDMKLIADFNDDAFEWWPWYEEYGKKWYWIGPEFGEKFKSTTQFQAGTYHIKVYNKVNSGNYVLAVGDDEKFTPLVILKLLFKLPKINKRFWSDVDCMSMIPGDNNDK
ncbi:MAG: hypothetical protein HKN08_00125 [Gammaproteobacteria bacterium]|nr:hypothetical protein [Gammaproteobacteria bacterium]